jgi:hypothetical protein
MTILRRYFISCASAEFRAYREELRRHLTSSNAEAKVQEDFTNGPATLLEKLDDYVANSSAVLHLVGKWAGSRAKPAEVRVILERYADFAAVLPELASWLVPDTCPFTYTQWECYLAIYHRIPCFIYVADDASQREPGWVEDAAETAAQEAHRKRIRSLGHDRTTFPFSDARDVALSFYRAYEGHVSGATFASETLAHANVSWPSPSGPLPYQLADRESECRLFFDLFDPLSSARILLIHGPSDRGKSLLLAEFERQTQVLSPLACGRADFKGGSSLREVLSGLSQDLTGAVRFARFERDMARTAEEPPRGAFLQDLSETHCPVVLLFDTYEDATDESRRWVEQSLFGLVRRFNGLRVVVSGQQVPVSDAPARWTGIARTHELPPITDPAPWCRYRDSLGVKDTPDDHVRTMVKAAKGSPRFLGSLLSNLQAAY